jgi:hypothetical protein
MTNDPSYFDMEKIEERDMRMVAAAMQGMNEMSLGHVEISLRQMGRRDISRARIAHALKALLERELVGVHKRITRLKRTPNAKLHGYMGEEAGVGRWRLTLAGLKFSRKSKGMVVTEERNCSVCSRAFRDRSVTTVCSMACRERARHAELEKSKAPTTVA